MSGSVDFNIDSLNHIHYLMNIMEYFCNSEEFNAVEEKYKNLVKYFIIDQEYDLTNIEKNFSDSSYFIKLCKQLKLEKNSKQ